MKYIKYVILLILVIPFSVNATFCPTSSKAQFKDQSENIMFTYDYVESDTVTFNITISNIPEDFIIKDVSNNKIYNYTKSEITLYNYIPEESYRFDIYVDDIFCSDDKMNSKYVITPAFNPYYKDEVCSGVEDYELCLKWQSMPFTYEEFVSRVTEYKKEIEQKPEDVIEVEYESVFSKMGTFFLDYYYYILPAIIIICLIIMVRRIRKDDLF